MAQKSNSVDHTPHAGDNTQFNNIVIINRSFNLGPDVDLSQNNNKSSTILNGSLDQMLPNDINYAT